MRRTDHPEAIFGQALLVVHLGVAIAACSSSSAGAAGGGGAATITGTVNGQRFNPVDTIALKGVYDTSYPGIVTIVMGNTTNLCALFQEMVGLPGSEVAKANFADLGFTLGATTSTSTVGVGTYTTGGNPNELDSAGWDTSDGACHATHAPGLSMATVTLTSVGAVYAGTFDLTYTDGSGNTGSFSAPLCTLDVANASKTTTSPEGGTACLP